MKKTWTITTLSPAPTITYDKKDFTGTYQEAVEACHASFKRTKRTTRLYNQGDTLRWWHAIVPSINGGIAEDRNLNSGVKFPAEVPMT